MELASYLFLDENGHCFGYIYSHDCRSWIMMVAFQSNNGIITTIGMIMMVSLVMDRIYVIYICTFDEYVVEL